MTKDNLYYLGKLGKPHGLLGFQYINIDKYFRDLDLSNVNISIGQKEYKIDNFKKHLKDRNLIKFENIDSVDESESLRNNEVFISSEYKYLTNKSNLPWPKFFIGYEFSRNVKKMQKNTKNIKEITLSYTFFKVNLKSEDKNV